MTRLVLSIALFAACTGDLSSGPTNPQQPPGGDPPLPADAVKLTARSGLAPQAGVTVIFQSPDDTVIAEVTTDATGIASARMPMGGSVTAIRSDLALVYTYVGVQPGDKLELAGAPPKTGPQTVKVLAGDPDPDVQIPITVMTPCGSGSGTSPLIEVTLDGCGDETDFYVIDEVGDDGDGPLTSAFLARAKIAPEIDLLSYNFSGSLTSTLSATNIPAGATVTVEKRLETDLFQPVASTGMIDIATDAELPNLAGVEEVSAALVTFADGGRQTVISRGTYQSTPQVIDVGPALIVQPSQAAQTVTGVSWTEQGSGKPDFVVTRLATATVVRTIAAPYAGTSTRIPALPPTHTYDLTDAAIDVHLVKLSVGYDTIRPHVFDHAIDGIAPRGERGTVASTTTPSAQ